jgi:bla regulator protein blaR1
MRYTSQALLLVVVAFAAASSSGRPLQNRAEERAAFEVVSVKPSQPIAGRAGRGGPLPAECGGAPPQIDGRRFAATNITLHRLIALAYGKHCRASLDIPLISGGAPWIRSDRFDIEAVIPEGSPVYTPEQLNNGEAPGLQVMLQSMLTDRFKLALHRETKEVSVYNLVLVKTGRVKLADDQTPPASPDPAAPFRIVPGGTPPRGRFLLGVDPPAGKVTIAATAVPITNIINIFQGQEGRLVVDKTDLKGLIDISPQTLDVGPFDISPSAVSVWPEIMLQLGLKLQPARGPAEILVIDRAEKPSEN